MTGLWAGDPASDGGWGSQPGQPSSNGGWEQQPAPSAQPAYGQPAYRQPAQPAYGQPVQPAYGQPAQPVYVQPAQPAYGQQAYDGGWSGQPLGGQQQAAHGQAPPVASIGSSFGLPGLGMPGMAIPGLPGAGLDGAAMQNMKGVAAGLAMDYGQQMAGKLHTNMNRWLPIDSMRYYFQLNNAFVSSKLKVLILPFTHKNWSRALAQSGGFAEPRHDINAPDLYVPTMAFVTYILLIAYHLGQQGRFTPEVFGMTASRGLGVVLIEVVLIKAAFYLFPTSGSSGAALLDLVAYSGYKFVGVVISSAVGLFVPSLFAHLVSLYLALCT
ncbi:YIF1-domain-containing protein, partial [Pavlovales sp. CCMP2436]